MTACPSASPNSAPCPREGEPHGGAGRSFIPRQRHGLHQPRVPRPPRRAQRSRTAAAVTAIPRARRSSNPGSQSSSSAASGAKSSRRSTKPGRRSTTTSPTTTTGPTKARPTARRARSRPPGRLTSCTQSQRPDRQHQRGPHHTADRDTHQLIKPCPGPHGPDITTAPDRPPPSPRRGRTHSGRLLVALPLCCRRARLGGPRYEVTFAQITQA